MKMIAAASALAAVATAAAVTHQAHEGGCDGKKPQDPLLQLFDADSDGRISELEMSEAEKILGALDGDQDGFLSGDELPRPPRPPHRGPRRHGPGNEGQRDARPPRPGFDELEATESAGTVQIRGGYETDPRDHGRPVVLIAAALGVEDQVFRDAFSRVTPARDGHPSPALAQRNKQVLMDALSRHGITNDRLDEVSNFYRYQPQRGDVWRHQPARVTAVFDNGKVTGFKIVDAGYGYTTPPRISLAGYGSVRVEAELGFSQDFRKNGRLVGVKVVD